MSELRAAVLRQRLYRVLGSRARALRLIAQEAERQGASAYLIGGPVRDLLMGLPIGDLDVLVSNGLRTLVRSSVEQLEARVTFRPRFLTATLETAEGHIDLSRARREGYARPGALPSVEPATVGEDFGRRDFSINAMALPLNRSAGRTLLDPLGGRADLEGRRIHILHGGSFRDDPTRLFRAVRYAARLGFRLSPETAKSLREALDADAIDTLSGDRIFHELEHLIDEPNSARAAGQLQKHGLLSALSPGWKLSSDVQRGLRRLDRVKVGAPWPAVAHDAVQRDCGLRLLVADVSAKRRAGLLKRLGLRGRRADEVLADLRDLTRLRRSLSRPLSPGTLDARLGGLRETTLLLIYCATGPPLPQQVTRYATALRYRKSALDGHRARALGLEGAEIGECLRAARARTLDGRCVDESWVKRWLARRRKMG